MGLNPFKNIYYSLKDILSSFKNSTKKEKGRQFFNVFLLIIGSFILAFGAAIFLIPDGIPAGGLSGLGVVITYMVPQFNIEIFVLIATWSLFLIGWIILGTKFILKTLIATIIFPLALLLFTNVQIFIDLANTMKASSVQVVTPTGTTEIFNNVTILLNGLFGGLTVGLGVSLTFLGGGSTGGVDIIYFIVKKYLRVKESLTSLVIDGIILLVGIVFISINRNDELLRPLIGIIAVLVTAMMIEYIYIVRNSGYVMEVISDKWEVINDFIQNEIKRGVTIFPIKGGYSLTDRVMLRVVFDRNEYHLIRAKIASIDPEAFVTFTRTEAVYGEGFAPHKPEKIIRTMNEEDKDGKAL